MPNEDVAGTLAGAETPYDTLTPDVVVAAVEASGFEPDGRVLALNSYENRVYQVGIEGATPVVVKFYRPGRWSRAAILEEHGFARELAAAEIPVVAPLEIGPGRTLLEYAGFEYAVYPRRGGHWPELNTSDERQWMGRFLGRMHRIGGVARFEHRPRLSIAELGLKSAEYLLKSHWLPEYLETRYADTVDQLLALCTARFEAVLPRQLRIHGDCHRGNILWTHEGPHFVDLDDCMTGPAMQDLWMLLAGNREETRAQLRDLLEGYEQFGEFDRGELLLIEPLRTLRMVHYEAWLARRWHDPAFPRAFPWFGAPTHWERHVVALVEQLEELEREPLRL